MRIFGFMQQRWNDGDINWKSKGKDFWLNANFAEMKRQERRKFLLNNGLQYRDAPICRNCNHVYFNCMCSKAEEYKEEIEACKRRIEEGKRLLSMSFEEKLKYSQETVDRTIRENVGKKIVLAYSGGIDSECCLQLFRQYIINGKVQVIWGDTLVEYPETRKRIAEMEQELGIKVIRATPERGISFKTVIKKYGLPIFSRASDFKEKAKATKMCCKLLKELPQEKLQKNMDVLILGLRAEENQYRKLRILRGGNYFYAKSYKQIRVLPIAYWSIEDVWKFQELMEFKYNELYNHTNCGIKGFYKLSDGSLYQLRTGCWCCPQMVWAGHLEWLRRYYPKYTKVLLFDYELLKYLPEIRKRKGIKVKSCQQSR